MSEAPERIWVWWDDRYDAGMVNTHGDERYTPKDAREYVRASRIEELEDENDLLKTSGIAEVAARNPNVMEYMRHWEGRAEAAEAKLAKAVEWQPIETAPTDEAILICGGYVLYPCVASLNNGEWDAEAQGGILREDIADYPTHWMPLPAPPSQN